MITLALIPGTKYAYSVNQDNYRFQVILSPSKRITAANGVAMLPVKAQCYSYSDYGNTVHTFLVKLAFEFHYRSKGINPIILDTFAGAKRLCNLYGKKMVHVVHGDQEFYAVLRVTV